VYNSSGETMSENNALKTYPLLTAADLANGRTSGQLTVQRRSCHGNSYFLYISSELAAFSKTVTPSAEHMAMVEKKRLKALQKMAPAALASVDAQLQALLNKKAELERVVAVAAKPSTKPKSTTKKRASRDVDSDSDGEYSPRDENDAGHQPARKSGRTERKRYTDPGEDDEYINGQECI